jgi:hypothetical protein
MVELLFCKREALNSNPSPAKTHFTVKKKKKKAKPLQVPVAHDCNPRYSGGRDQEDRGSKPA